MAQADGKNELQRVSLNLRASDNTNLWYNFMINPEEYEERHPQRTSVFRTREAVVVEDFGPDIGTIQFSGTTGFRTIQEGSGGPVRNGVERLRALEDLIGRYSLSGYTTEPGGNPNNAELIFYNRTDGKSWYVHIDTDGFSITRSATESLLYRYSLSLLILRKASEPDERDKDSAYIGNPIPVADYQTSTQGINQPRNPRSSNSIYEDAKNNASRTIGTSTDPNGPSIRLD